MKAIHKEITVKAPIEAVWNAWTTSDGIKSFFSPEAYIDLRMGGAFEVYFLMDNPRGFQGSEGCKVLAYLPKKMLSFSWNCPPEFERIRKSGEQNFVVLLFDELPEGRIKVTLDHIEWKEGDGDWDRIYDYFDNAWSAVLAGFQEYFLQNA
jgi:uncharacterized protein YndB with AHSA1/START domain